MSLNLDAAKEASGKVAAARKALAEAADICTRWSAYGIAAIIEAGQRELLSGQYHLDACVRDHEKHLTEKTA